MKKTVSYTTKQDMLDPDVRFLLANERTLLAWVRTSIALLAGGVVLQHLGSENDYERYMGVMVLIAGAATSLVGYIRFKAADSAIRKGHLPSPGYGPVIQVIAVIAVAVSLVVLELLS